MGRTLKTKTVAGEPEPAARPAGDAEPMRRIRVPKTSEIVANHIRGQIIRGELQEGDSLPPEGLLMTSFGVSRPTLREAFRILEAENLISVVRGSRSGARVHQPRVELVSRYAGYALQAQHTTVADIYEARLAIEPHIVRRLATQAPTGAVQRLRDEVERLKRLVQDERYVDFIAGTANFHRLVVEVGGNVTLNFLNQLLLDLVARHQVSFFRRHPTTKEAQLKRYSAAIRSYEKLIDLIEAKDADAAVAHWQLHLHNANSTWVGPDEGDRIVDALGETALDMVER
jgi:DNA-binding FadR family transcriptional regulator